MGETQQNQDSVSRDKVEVVAEQVGDVLLSLHTGPRFWRGVALGLLLLLLLDLLLGWYWSREPALLDIKPAAITGQATSGALIQVTSTLLDKPGGFISNDMMPHRLWLDDMPAWETGVLDEVRSFLHAMRQNFGRDVTRHLTDADLAEAESQFYFSSHSWAIPSSEGEYRRGIEALQRYRSRLALSPDNAEHAVFRTDAEALDVWLANVDVQLGKWVQSLSNSVGQEQVAGLGGAGITLSARTPWLQLDDVFYSARGHAWALAALLSGMRKDAAGVLAEKHATLAWQQALVELQATQQFVWSPMVLNGKGFGVLANHSLMLANYLHRARMDLAEVRRLLQQPQGTFE